MTELTIVKSRSSPCIFFKRKLGSLCFQLIQKLNIRIILLSKVIIKCLKQQLDTLENTDSGETWQAAVLEGRPALSLSALGSSSRHLQVCSRAEQRLTTQTELAVTFPLGWRDRIQKSRASSRVGWRRKWQPTSIFLPGRSHGQIDEPGGLHSMVSQKSETQLSD